MTSRIWPRMQSYLRRFRSSSNQVARLAVLVDADGVSARDAERVLENVFRLGRICILRTYGNFSGSSAGTWAKVLKTYGAVARHMPSVALKKNASDIALSVDATEILLTRGIDTFVIIASDSDFTPLVRRISEDGKNILGFGYKSTPPSYRNACTSFQEMHTLVGARKLAEPLWSLQPADAEELVLPVLHRLCTDGRSIELSTFGYHLSGAVPGFDTRVYSRRTLSDLLRELPGIELLDIDGKRFARPTDDDTKDGGLPA